MTICDSHVHVVADPSRILQVANRRYTAGQALLAELERVAAPRDVTRFVVVQPSFYGVDNTVLLETLTTLGNRSRGIAVIDPATIRSHELATLAARGVRGLRLNFYNALSGEEGALEPAVKIVSAVARLQKWHVEIVAPIGMVARAAICLAQSPVPVVIEHYGLFKGATPDNAAGAALLSLLRRPHVWMKLSAPYRVSDDPLETRPDPAWLTAILGAGGERCVWGSDWPHTPPHEQQTGAGAAAPYRALNYGAVLDGFRHSLPHAALEDVILRQNPAQLYGFA